MKGVGGPIPRRVAILVAAVAVASAAAFALAAGRTPDPSAVPSAQEVHRRVMSPFCPGLTLEECPTRQAAELRGRIEERTSAGWTNREIDTWLVANYGEAVLGRPQQAAVWAVPGVVVAAGALLVALLVTRWVRVRDPAPGPEMTARDRELLDLDLRKFKESME